MKQPGSGLEERRKAAANAKQLLLNKFKAAPKPNDPEMLAKRAEREAIAAAREARYAERERVKTEQAERQKTDAAERKAAEEATRAEGLKKEADTAVADQAARKAERDRRYAARKARR